MVYLWTTASFKLKIEDFHALEYAAQMQGMSISAYVRSKVMSDGRLEEKN